MNDRYENLLMKMKYITD